MTTLVLIVGTLTIIVAACWWAIRLDPNRKAQR